MWLYKLQWNFRVKPNDSSVDNWKLFAKRRKAAMEFFDCIPFLLMALAFRATAGVWLVSVGVNGAPAPFFESPARPAVSAFAIIPKHPRYSPNSSQISDIPKSDGGRPAFSAS